MIEKDLLAMHDLAQQQGIRQRLLTDILFKTYSALRKLGLRDISPGAALTAQTQRGELLTDEDRTRALVLRDRGLQTLRQPIEKMGVERSNTVQLQEALAVVTNQYYWLFAGKIPPTKYKIFRREKALTHEWNEQEATERLEATYEYKINYISGKNPPLTAASVRIRTQSDPESSYYSGSPAPLLTMKFDDEGMTGIGLHWRQNRPEGLLKLTGDTSLGKILKEQFVYPMNGSLAHNAPHGFTIDLSGTPVIKFEQFFNTIWSWTTDKKPLADLVSWYRYMADSNVFTRYFKDEDEYRRNRLPTQGRMSTVEFVDIVRSTLDLVPTVDVSKI